MAIIQIQKKGLRATVLLLGLAALSMVCGCSSWRAISHDEIETTLEQKPSKVRVATEGTTVLVYQPTLSADSLRGKGVDHRSITVPSSRIDGLWIHSNNRHTARIIAATALGMASAFLILEAIYGNPPIR